MAVVIDTTATIVTESTYALVTATDNGSPNHFAITSGKSNNRSSLLLLVRIYYQQASNVSILDDYNATLWTPLSVGAVTSA